MPPNTTRAKPTINSNLKFIPSKKITLLPSIAITPSVIIKAPGMINKIPRMRT